MWSILVGEPCDWQIRNAGKKGEEIREKRPFFFFFSQPHLREQMHAHTQGNTHRDPQRCLLSQQTEWWVTRGVGRRLWNQLSLCKNSLLLFVQSGHSQSRRPGWKHVQRAENFQITSPPSVESFYVLTANSTIWPKLTCCTYTVVIRGKYFVVVLFIQCPWPTLPWAGRGAGKRQKSIFFLNIYLTGHLTKNKSLFTEMVCQSSCRETESSYETQQADARPSAAGYWAAPLDQLVGNGLLKGDWEEECYSRPSPDLILLTDFKPAKT